MVPILLSLGPTGPLVGKIPTDNLPDWFDAQKNDFNPHKSFSTRAVKLMWFRHSGDTFGCLARPFIIHWSSESDLSDHGHAEAIASARVVYWWEYACRGTCSLAEESNDDQTQSQRDSHQEESQPEAATKPKPLTATTSTATTDGDLQPPAIPKIRLYLTEDGWYTHTQAESLSTDAEASSGDLEYTQTLNEGAIITNDPVTHPCSCDEDPVAPTAHGIDINPLQNAPLIQDSETLNNNETTPITAPLKHTRKWKVYEPEEHSYGNCIQGNNS
ncbi:hypothetical protein K439DRAFT_1620826 [Ramaria rubella]|nr:hypothetical protein K439DRAFT_1620826 [Ramaria rubella]